MKNYEKTFNTIARILLIVLLALHAWYFFAVYPPLTATIMFLFFGTFMSVIGMSVMMWCLEIFTMGIITQAALIKLNARFQN